MTGPWHHGAQRTILLVACRLENTMSAVTVRLDDDTANALDRLAESLDRSPDDVAAQAIREYVALQAWQRAEIEAGLAQADAGDFAGDADVARVLKKFGRA
jgi:predicted transcriptional regulator